MPLKAQFGQKLARDVMYYHNRIIQRFEKNGYSRQSCRLPDSSIRGVVVRKQISPRIRSQNQNSSKCSVRDLGQSDLCRQTDRQKHRQKDRLRNIYQYCFLLYSKYSTYVVLNALYYILGGGP